jgi:DNA primase
MVHILGYYGIELNRISSNHLAGCCPIHKGDSPNAFHVDLEKNLFHCFTRCGGGSIFDFLMKKENLSFYQAAKKVWETFYLQEQEQQQEQKGRRLHFHLKLQHHHPYLWRRNIDANLARYFQMGFCQHGMMKNRIAIPIFDINGNLVAYCGRAVDENIQPKYLFPRNFNKSHHLFNIQHIGAKDHWNKPIFLVEGFFDCIHIVKLGFDALAIMGNSVSRHQLKLLKKINRFYILMLDGDEAGIRGTTRISEKMRHLNLSFKPVWLIDVREPEELDYDNLEMIAYY